MKATALISLFIFAFLKRQPAYKDQMNNDSDTVAQRSDT